MNNLPKHPCENKCARFKDEQCSTRLISYSEFPNSSDFVVGDIVTYEKVDSLFEITSIIEDKLIVKNVVTKRIYKQQSYMFQHATPAELKAKKRLPEPVALFVSDYARLKDEEADI